MVASAPSWSNLLNMFVQPRHDSLEGKSYDVYLEDFLKNKDCPMVFKLRDIWYCKHHSSIGLVPSVIDFQENAVAFYKFLETTFPAQPGVFGTKMKWAIFFVMLHLDKFLVCWECVTNTQDLCYSCRPRQHRGAIAAAVSFASSGRLWPSGNSRRWWNPSFFLSLIVECQISCLCVLTFAFCIMFSKDVQHSLAQLLCLNGMMTDSNQPGVERIVCSKMKSSWRTGPPSPLDINEHFDSDVCPQQVFMVKGWNRSVCCLAVLLATYESTAMLEADTHTHVTYVHIHSNICSSMRVNYYSEASSSPASQPWSTGRLARHCQMMSRCALPNVGRDVNLSNSSFILVGGFF